MFNNTIVRLVASRLKLNSFKRKWRKHNSNNGTYAKNIFPIDNVSIGNNTYGELNIVTFNDISKLKIGSYCSIAQNVKFMLDVEHNINTISTFPYKVRILNQKKRLFLKEIS